MAKITYTNKVALNENPEIALINKVTDDDLNEIKSVVNTNDDNVGNLTNLTTTTKTNIVAAVNEINSNAASATDLGDISDLTTTDKTSAVNAINELNSDKAEDDIILVQSTEPTSDTNILWINDGQIGTPASEITNSYSTSTGIGYSANYVNNLFQPKNLWSGTKYTTGDTLVLSEELQTGHLYMMTCMGISATFTVTLPFIYTGNALIQIAYANVAGGSSEGFRYRLAVNSTTLTIDNNSQNNIANTAIKRIDFIM